MPQDNIQKRQVAYKIRIKDIINSKYVKKEGWTPNYIVTEGNKEISRINLIAVVVSKPVENNTNYSSIVLDDGSSKISARVFDNSRMFDKVDIGDVALLIGRPREYGQEKYIMAEIVKKIENKEWINLRKLELKKQGTEPKKTTNIEPAAITEKPTEEEAVVEDEAAGKTEKIYNLIRSMDHGEGVDYQEVVEKIGAENEISALLKEGEIYEIIPGRLKVL